MGLGTSFLVTGQGYSNDTETWRLFKTMVQNRMTWLGNLAIVKATPEKPLHSYVDVGRIAELAQITKSEFDLTKLICLCEEINICFSEGCYLATAMVARSILDHVPPIFGYTTFKEFANSYGFGGKSFKEQMLHLEEASRKISDGHLHSRIRSSETLPNAIQVNFSNTIDSLLSEIVRVLK